MKELLAMLLLVLIVASGWNQPFKSHFRYLYSVVSGTPLERPPAKVPPTPARDNSWRLK